MAIKAKVTQTVSKLGDIMKAVQKYVDTELTIGIQSADAKEPRGDGINMAGLGAVHEFGTRDGRIPARPFLSPVAEDKQYRRQYAKLIQAEGVASEKSAERALKRVGERAVNIAQKRISDGLEPANAPATVAAKGSSKPLIDTGRLRQSITYKLNRKKGSVK